ncbi:MAG: YtxH domain-containing protein [Sphingobacteriales bacterium]|nr:YtxH domain-containing protein [Sphingobacteriales bacterium]MBK8444084.1 YtxH domain-containing protein [Sphingobacteriales bacterium]
MKRLGYLVVGLALGTGIALLIAPEKGAKTRKKLKRLAEDLQDELQTRAERQGIKLNELKEKGAQKMSELRESAEDFVENAAKRINSTVAGTREKAATTYDELID